MLKRKKKIINGFQYSSVELIKYKLEYRFKYGKFFLKLRKAIYSIKEWFVLEFKIKLKKCWRDSRFYSWLLSVKYSNFKNKNLFIFKAIKKAFSVRYVTSFVFLSLLLMSANFIVQGYEAHIINITAKIVDNTPQNSLPSGNICEDGVHNYLTLNTPVEGASILYTLDGTDPQCSENGIEYTEPVLLPHGSIILKAITCYDGRQSGTFVWNYNVDPQYCAPSGDGEWIEVVAGGMGTRYQSVNPLIMNVSNPDNINMVMVQAVVKGVKPGSDGYETNMPEQVIFTSSNGETYTLNSPSNSTPGYGFFYEQQMQPADWYKAEVVGEGGVNYKTPRALNIYVYRQGPKDSQLIIPDQGIYWKASDRPMSHTESFTLPQGESARDIEVDFVVSELGNGCRVMEVYAEMGGVQYSKTYSASNMGDEAHIASVVLENVPADATQLTTTVTSPDSHPGICDEDSDGKTYDDNGDSIYWSGIVVTYPQAK